MNIKVPGSELNRVMKTMVQCIDPKDQNRSCVEIMYTPDNLIIRGTDGNIHATMYIPMLGGDGETFCVDGTMFARICSMSGGDIAISTDGKNCTVKGTGRARIPIVDAHIPSFDSPEDNILVTAYRIPFVTAYNGVAFAVATDQSRLVLTGVKVDTLEQTMTMTALDGFRLSEETLKCDGNGSEMHSVIPGNFLKILRDSTSDEDIITIFTDEKRITAETDNLKLGCVLLQGTYPPVKQIIPEQFKTEVLLNTGDLRTALKSNSIVCGDSKMVKLIIASNKLTVTGNSDKGDADYEAEIKCQTSGDGLTIAFNQKYLLETINSISEGEIVMKFNESSKPCVICAKDGNGFRLILPVRVGVA